MSTAQKIIPTTDDERNLESVVDSVVTSRIKRPSLASIARVAVGVSAVAGIATLVLETERQRREITSMKRDHEATVSFVKTLIDETNCGAEAYLYLQMVADEEDEETADWSEEDDLPVPFDVTEEGAEALAQYMIDEDA